MINTADGDGYDDDDMMMMMMLLTHDELLLLLFALQLISCSTTILQNPSLNGF